MRFMPTSASCFVPLREASAAQQCEAATELHRGCRRAVIKGILDLNDVAAVVLETDGKLTVVANGVEKPAYRTSRLRKAKDARGTRLASRKDEPRHQERSCPHPV
jgi:hypothetical protein